jgi:hypothetical protein
MKNLIAILTILFSIPVFGQKQYLGLKGGMSWTNIISDNFSDKNDSRNGFTGGLTYEYEFMKNFHLELDFLYAQKGFRNDIIFTDQFGQPTGEEYTTHYDYDYLSLPIKGSFSIGNKLSGFINVGIVSSYLIKASIRTPGLNLFGFDADSDDIDKVNRFDFSGIAEVGGSYKLKERFLLFTSFSYQQSFTSITTENYFSNSDIRHYGMILSLGLKYAIGE